MAGARVREAIPAVAVFDRCSRESRERCSTRVWRATVMISRVRCVDKLKKAHGASVGVSGLEGGSGISIRVGVAIANRLAVHADGLLPASS